MTEIHRHNTHPVSNSLTANYHTYGVLIGEQETVYYFDRREIWRIPTPPQYRVPMFPLVNLALGAGWSSEETPSPSYLYVDYVRVYSEAPTTSRTPRATCLLLQPDRTAAPLSVEATAAVVGS